MSGVLSQYTTAQVVIASGQPNSTAFRVAEFNKGSFHAPDTLTGNQFTVQVSNDGTNYNALQTAAGAAVAVIPATVNEANMLPSETFNFQWARLVSSGNEGADRTIPLFLKG